MANATRSTKISCQRSRICRQSSGCALGFDRLVMLATGAPDRRSHTLDAARRTGQVMGYDCCIYATTFNGQGSGGRLDLIEHGTVSPSLAKCRLRAMPWRLRQPWPPPSINGANAGDPIARQFVPSLGRIGHAGPTRQPTRSAMMRTARSRASCTATPTGHLLKVSSVCPVYCRFCFRREAVGPDLGEALITSRAASGAIDYIRRHSGRFGKSF